MKSMDSSKGFYRGSRLPLSVVKLYDTRSPKSMKIHEIHENPASQQKASNHPIIEYLRDRRQRR